MLILKNLVKRYYTPTPVFWRMVGDAILYGCGLASVNSVIQNNSRLTIGFIVVAMVGKFLSNIPRKDDDAK
jgi:hypothetical protein